VSPRSDVALVHDYLLVMRGAERTFAAMADCWPEAPIATLLYDAESTAHRFDGRAIATSVLQRLPVRQRGFRALLPLLPYAAERLDTGSAKLVVSSSSAFAHGVRTPGGGAHVCYCHSPFRYAWHERERGLAELPSALRPLVGATLTRIRKWDRAAAHTTTAYIANAEITQRRIQEFWGREAPIVHPPVDVDRFEAGDHEDFFLVVCELVRHKQVDLALEAALLAGRPIKVVGDGPDRRRLEALYGESATFLGRVADDELATLYSRALALVVPNVEEFGIAAVEAQAAGRPVLGTDQGGTRETVVPGETGVLVPAGDVRATAEAMADEDFGRFDPARVRRNADRFARGEFQRKLVAEVERVAAAAGVAPETGTNRILADD
jgi:glycosyltransferase involved in cell wall biosynthesis